jgi:hypothetical protein
MRRAGQVRYSDSMQYPKSKWPELRFRTVVGDSAPELRFERATG